MARLGDVCNIVSGTTPKSTCPEYWDGEINWVTPAELTDDSDLVFDSQRKITRQAVMDSSLKPFPAGTVLLSSRAPIGKVAIAGIEMYCNQGFKNLICSDSIYNRYLFHFLKSKTEYLNSLGRGATFKEISKSIVENIEIPLPALEEQRHIAALLDKVSDLIAKRRAQLDKLDLLVKAKFVEMFGSYENNKTKAGTFFLNMRNGVSPSTKGQYPSKVLTLSAITQGYFDGLAWKDGLFDEEPANDKRINATDFYICRGNGNKTLVGVGVYSAQNHHELVFPDTVIAAQVDTTQIRLPYLFHAWKQPDVRKQIESAARTTNGTYKVNQKILSDINITLPPINLQNNFSAFVEQIEKPKRMIYQSLDRLETLKKALMQQYFG